MIPPLATGRYLLTKPEDGILVRTSVGDGRGRYRDLPHCKDMTPYGVFGVDHDYPTYRKRYRERLNKHRDLTERWLNDHDESQRLVLGCFCDLTVTDAWCHRTILAEWLNQVFDVDVPELHPPAAGWAQGTLL